MKLECENVPTMGLVTKGVRNKAIVSSIWCWISDASTISLTGRIWALKHGQVYPGSFSYGTRIWAIVLRLGLRLRASNQWPVKGEVMKPCSCVWYR